ncbi:MAG: aminotransferase class V-fold PLP-dependent enzyme [Oscillospiraceae bacterium]|nr:aminotransferase class V-fold PLP-dependent enzyme [Oscillospiraceae bacterium]
MNVKTPICDFLTAYTGKKRTRCHTPGSKGRVYKHDITEINGADSLYEPCSCAADTTTGIIAESENIAARLFGAAKTLYSCSGSTLAVQTMLSLIKTSAEANGKNRIAAFRYAHRSFISAAALLGFDIDWIYPEEFLSACLKPEAVKEAVRPDTAAVFVNSLDYYGGMCGIQEISSVCKQADIPLLVDNAHGAYFILTGGHPITHGASMTADSAHKTLPVMTGAAYLHINDTRFTENAKSAMAVFGTSSPSYLILESLDTCNKHIAEAKDKVKQADFAFALTEELKQSLKASGFALKESDLLRITVNARESGYTGVEFAAELRQNGVEPEYADENYTVLLFSTVTNKKEITAVNKAFQKIKIKKPLPPLIYPVIKPKSNISAREALFHSKHYDITELNTAKDRICAEVIAPCPPGIPLIMPGELIGADEIELLKSFRVKRIRVIR